MNDIFRRESGLIVEGVCGGVVVSRGLVFRAASRRSQPHRGDPSPLVLYIGENLFGEDGGVMLLASFVLILRDGFRFAEGYSGPVGL